MLRRVGHVRQGRYKAILVKKDSDLLELSRYGILDPVRKQIDIDTADWPWSRNRATTSHMPRYFSMQRKG